MRSGALVWAVALAGAFLAATLVVLTFARSAYVEATVWVQHTNDVKLAIADARIAFDEGERARAEADIRRVRDLTVDNPRQQGRIAALDLGKLDARATLSALTNEEDTLLAVRSADEQSKRSLVWGLLFGSGALTIAFAIASVVILRRGQRELDRQSALVRSIVDSIGDSVLAIDPARRFLVTNAAFRAMFARGVARGELAKDSAHRQDARNEDGTPLGGDDGPLPRALRGEHVDGFVLSIQSATSSDRIWLSATSRPVLNEEGDTMGAVAVLRDVTAERQARATLLRHAEDLRVQSLMDDLTGLYNRRGFLLFADQHARTAARSKRPFAVLFADLDGLKSINDTHGHDEGDRAIRRTAAILKASLRESDLVARLGGDEFVALLDGATEEVISHVMARIHHELAIDAAREASAYVVAMSTGVAFQTSGETRTIEELLALADERMYATKTASRSARA